MKLLMWALLIAAAPVWGAVEEAQKIAELRAAPRENIWQFFSALPSSFEAQIFYGLAISGLTGLIASWLWKWSQGMADGLAHFTPKYVIGQVLWLIGASVAAVATVGFQTESGEFYGWISVLWTGAFAGFSGEMKTNKDTKGSPTIGGAN